MSVAAGVRSDFQAAAHTFVAVVSSVADLDLGRPGLGVWSLRDLIGHASRALLTVETYLASPAPGPAVVADAVEYFRAARALLADPEAIAERGRQAGAALGDDVRASVAELASRVVALVGRTPGDALVATPVGAMRLDGYLPTRTFELVVHSIDVADAGGVEPPAAILGPARACLQLAAQLATTTSDATTVLRALTGRSALPPAFSVL